MSRQLPYLAMDGILCDYGLPMVGGKAKRNTKMTNVMTTDETMAHAKKLVSRLLGQDSAMDDETVEKLKAFLQSKLSSEDHAAACSMMDGSGAQDEPAPGGTEPPAKFRGTANDSKADFYKQFPGAARIRVDSSGIQPRGRASSYSAAGAASFAAMFPDAARIKLL